MCIEACKNMMVVCVEHVINVEVIQNKSKDIQIEAPGQQVKQIKEFVLSLHKAAEDANKKVDEEARKKAAEEAEAAAHKKDDDNEKEDPKASKMGGMFGGKAFKNTMRKAISLSV